MSGEIRVIVYCRAPEEGEAPLEAAFHQINEDLGKVPGLLRSELLQSTLDGESGSFAVLSHWKDVQSFQAWEQGAAHRKQTSPLRQYQDRGGSRHYGIYQVRAAFAVPGHA
ncbi:MULTISPECIES: antibiotic biosynthesis monooxygenase [unclassified Streptomyces]|uniref:antibiotic biosynthesis monooxygenase family protein n=1 Tax=unclassified Streptomyces TaxID=2593676 RepID=UPI00332801E6